MSVSTKDPVSTLLERPDAGWSLTVYQGAREAGGGFRSSYRPPHRVGVRGQAVDPERSRDEAGRRARGKLRRYGAQNGLNRLGTLTYEGAGCHDPREVRAHVGEFFRALRELTGGKAFPYIWVPSGIRVVMGCTFTSWSATTSGTGSSSKPGVGASWASS